MATTLPYYVGLDCEPGALPYCWSAPSGQGTCYNVNGLGGQVCNVSAQAYSFTLTQGTSTPSMNSFNSRIASIQSGSSACTGGTGWTISNACAMAAIAVGGGQNLGLIYPCNSFTGFQQYSCQLSTAPGTAGYVLTGNLLPAKLLGQDGNFTGSFSEQCSSSLTEACPSSTQCPSSAPTGCKALVRTFTTGTTSYTVTDLIYSLGVELRLQIQGQQPVFTILCNGAGISFQGITAGPCAGAGVNALQGPLAYLNTNDKMSGKVVINVAAPLFAYSSPYDFYGFWNAYIGNSGCIPSVSINPCTSHASLGFPSAATFKDPGQWSPQDFINLPKSVLAQNAQLTFTINGFGPTYGVTVQNPNGSNSNCSSDLNNANSPSTGTCTLTITGNSLIRIPIIFQELAQVTVGVAASTSGTGTCYQNVTASCINTNPVTNGTIRVSASTGNYKPGGNVGNVTKTYQNATNPFETIVVKVTDTSGIFSILTCCSGLVVTLNPIGASLTTNASGIVVFIGVPPSTVGNGYTVVATDPGGFALGPIYTVPPNHVTPSPTVSVPNLGTGTYLVPVTMTTTWAGTFVILLTVGIIIFILALTTGVVNTYTRRGVRLR